MRSEMYKLLWQLHCELYFGTGDIKAPTTSMLYDQCVELASNECFNLRERACVTALKTGNDPIAVAATEEDLGARRNMYIYERVLHKYFLFKPAQDGVRDTASFCSSCKFVSRMYGDAYVDAECSCARESI